MLQAVAPRISEMTWVTAMRTNARAEGAKKMYIVEFPFRSEMLLIQEKGDHFYMVASSKQP